MYFDLEYLTNVFSRKHDFKSCNATPNKRLIDSD